MLLGGGAEAKHVFKSLSKDNASHVAELSPEQYPKLVNFKDRNDPKTIELALETEPCADPKTGIPRSSVCIKEDRMQEIYGEGVRLKSITLEQTEQSFNVGELKRHLKWFREPGYSLGLKFFDPANPQPAKYIISDEFQTRGN